MPHILVAGKLHPSGVALLKSTPGVTFDYVEEVSEQSYHPFIGKADALVLRTQPLSASTVANANRLKVVSRHGVGYDAVHVASLNERGIALTVVGDVNSVSVAEHAMMLILSAAKRVLRGDRAVRNPSEWGWRNRLEAEEISGKRLLIIGFGRIGRHLSRMAEGFGMEIRAFDPYLQAQGWPKGPVLPADDLLKGLQWADVVSVNVPKADRPIIGKYELAAMKPGAILVNTARGGVVDEAALIEALQSEHLGAAGLDVFDDEPPSEGCRLLAFDQVVLSPHIAGLTRECGERMAVASVQNVLDFFAGKIDPSLVVNADQLPAN
ncbi:hydroxyacid dehydrogenase [Rhizobium leguminosarum]|uniref:hydroxyacid dehydrogenase n=1 Tax=Rhizobium leguminosarum TaxID=384 RepID=UPI001C98243F|nr:hydroxyacid dehydrogenase [Rhizobium leguminosarum]MBY5757989.1 hydroxyacid dehydrogenase [Rhizobium leguminosarum]